VAEGAFRREITDYVLWSTHPPRNFCCTARAT